ncbi:MAG: hypothetical protein ACTHJQ_07100 [Rhizobiaceae bacterium]
MEERFPDSDVRRTIETLRQSIWNRNSADVREGLEDRRRMLRLKQIPALGSHISVIEASLLAFERTLVDAKHQAERKETKAKLIAQLDQLLAKLGV